LPEQLDPFTGAPLSVSPLTWSRGELVAVTMRYVKTTTKYSPELEVTQFAHMLADHAACRRNFAGDLELADGDFPEVGK